MEKVVGGDQQENRRAQILAQYPSNRYHPLSVDEQIDCIIDQATDVDILGRSWIGLETFMWFQKTCFVLTCVILFLLVVVIVIDQ